MTEKERKIKDAAEKFVYKWLPKNAGLVECPVCTAKNCMYNKKCDKCGRSLEL